MDGAKVLVVEDDARSAELLRRLLAKSGASIVEASDGRAALKALYTERPDVVLLDINLPEMDGWQVLERMRQLSEVPIMMVTARQNEAEKVRALRAGAEDYVTKPFGLDEIVARVEVLARRSRGTRPQSEDSFVDGDIEIDFRAAEVRAGSGVVELTPLEFRLLSAFVKNPNRVLTPQQLLDMAWRDGSYSPERVKTYVGYIRAKLRAHGVDPSPIETVRGFGYRYRPS